MEEGPESIWRDVGDLYPLDASDDKPCRNALLVSDSLSKYEKSLQWIEHFFGSEFLKQQCKFAFDSIDTDKVSRWKYCKTKVCQSLILLHIRAIVLTLRNCMLQFCCCTYNWEKFFVG